ncbi:winged helix-turn-helix domain-containing protein [Butyrivibrio proteoclasticus]|uniref:winged helix-turn-helix domain-containing protein n=1 Tax=Butyrivibrio proteoclasticus TaxID=43305 RepID=UPI00047DA7CB|nr:winged helix-turn-helix domain-containing protein [Butyrivibrio proteoclasticus]
MSWYESRTDICSQFEKGNYEFLHSYTENNAENIIREWITHSENLSALLQMGTAIMKRFERKCIQDERERNLYMLGVLRGILKASARYETEQSKKAYAWRQSSGDLSRVKYLNDIIIELYEHGGRTQAELAEALGINTSTLSERLKRISDTDFILAHKSGKYKFFELSEYGRKYYITIKDKRNELDKNSERYRLYYKMLSSVENNGPKADCTKPDKLTDQNDEKKEKKKTVSNVIRFDECVALKGSCYKRKAITSKNYAKDILTISNNVGGSEDEDVREN